MHEEKCKSEILRGFLKRGLHNLDHQTCSSEWTQPGSLASVFTGGSKFSFTLTESRFSEVLDQNQNINKENHSYHDVNIKNNNNNKLSVDIHCSFT